MARDKLDARAKAGAVKDSGALERQTDCTGADGCGADGCGADDITKEEAVALLTNKFPRMDIQKMLDMPPKAALLNMAEAFGNLTPQEASTDVQALAPQVQLLREVRDNIILETQSGTAFLSGFNQIYYSFSPTMADIERENPAFRYLVGALVTPMLHSLHIMTLADGSSESAVILLGLVVMVLNVAVYVAVPVWIGFFLARRIRSKLAITP